MHSDLKPISVMLGVDPVEREDSLAWFCVGDYGDVPRLLWHDGVLYFQQVAAHPHLAERIQHVVLWAIERGVPYSIVKPKKTR